MRKNRSGKWKTFWWNYTARDENGRKRLSKSLMCWKWFAAVDADVFLPRLFFFFFLHCFARSPLTHTHTHPTDIFVSGVYWPRLRSTDGSTYLFAGDGYICLESFVFFFFLPCVCSHHVINRVINEHYRKFIYGGDKGAIRCLRIVVCRFA